MMVRLHRVGPEDELAKPPDRVRLLRERERERESNGQLSVISVTIVTGRKDS